MREIVWAFSVCFIFVVGCAQKSVKPTVTVSQQLPLLQLKNNPAFFQDEAGNFETVPEATEKIRIYQHQFPNQQELQSYILNRRMLLHQSFQDQIAPYFGLIQLNKACLANVDTKGDIEVIDSSEDFMVMSFPANDSKTLSDCSTEGFWGRIEYRFHNCKKTNTVFELRISRQQGVESAGINPRCL